MDENLLIETAAVAVGLEPVDAEKSRIMNTALSEHSYDGTVCTCLAKFGVNVDSTLLSMKHL